MQLGAAAELMGDQTDDDLDGEDDGERRKIVRTLCVQQTKACKYFYLPLFTSTIKILTT